MAKNCSDRKKVICKYCKGKNHSALCVESQGNVETQENQRVPVNIESVGMTTTGNSMHVSTGNSVALQTAQAQIAGKGTSRVWVLFDTASHKSFVTSQVVKSFELETLRREWPKGHGIQLLGCCRDRFNPGGGRESHENRSFCCSRNLA